MKPRNLHAVAAWMRLSGAHGGPKKPDFDETEEGLADYEEGKDDERERRIPLRPSEVPK